MSVTGTSHVCPRSQAVCAAALDRGSVRAAARTGPRPVPRAPAGGGARRALLALLLLNANHVVSRERLIDALWGDDLPETAVQTLQVYVSRLRKLLPPGTLVTRPPGALLEAAPEA